MSFNAIRENKIIAKISESSVRRKNGHAETVCFLKFFKVRTKRITYCIWALTSKSSLGTKPLSLMVPAE